MQSQLQQPSNLIKKPPNLLKQIIELHNIESKHLIYIPQIQTSIKRSFSGYSSSLQPFKLVLSAFRSLYFSSISTILICFINMLITLSIPFANNFILNQIVPQTSSSFKATLFIVLQILILKIIKITSLLGADMIQMTTGVKYYGYFMSSINYHYNRLNKADGTIINYIEDDSERTLNIPYSLINLVFNTIQLLTFCTVVTYLLNSSTSFLVPLLIFIFLILCSIVGYFSYRINQQMMKSKDSRITSNLQGYNVLDYRMKQIKQISNLLRLNLGLKLLGVMSYAVLFFVVFWVEDKSIDSSTKNLLLMILGLMKSRIQRLVFLFCLVMDIYNSLKRVSQGILIIPQNQNREFGQLNRNNFRIKQERTNQVQQKGQINILKLYNSLKPAITNFSIAMLIKSLLVAEGISIFLLEASKNVLNGSSLIYFLPPLLQIFSTAFVFLSLQNLTISSSKYISNSMLNKTNSYQILNRFSGDIRALDRNICLNGFDFVTVVLSILASLIYTIKSIDIIWVTFCFAISIIGIIYLCIKINRYFMKSRRLVMREECLSKSKLIKSFFQNNQQFYQALYKVFSYKMLGIKIQFLSLVFILSLSIFITLIVIITCIQLNFQHSMTVLLVFVFMQLDTDIVNLFINGIRFQIALTSFERCVNAQYINQSREEQPQQLEFDN